LITTFSGTTGLVVKIALLSLVNAATIWAIAVLADHHKWRPLVAVVFATVAIDAVYLLNRKWTVPLKFLLPGTVFLIVFHVLPVIYTVNVAFTN